MSCGRSITGVEQLLAEEVRELRAAAVPAPGPTILREPVLTREQSVGDWCRARNRSSGVRRGAIDPLPQNHESAPGQLTKQVTTTYWSVLVSPEMTLRAPPEAESTRRVDGSARPQCGCG